jgi:hypothetical protein
MRGTGEQFGHGPGASGGEQPGRVRPGEPGGRTLAVPRAVRCGLLPQRDDLLRHADQGGRARTRSTAHCDRKVCCSSVIRRTSPTVANCSPCRARPSTARSAEDSMQDTPRLALLRRRPKRTGEASFFFFDHTFQVEACKVLPGEYFVYNEDIVIQTVLGSCVAACLVDRGAGIGGMNHFLLPEGDDSSARYGAFAMELLINELMKAGRAARQPGSEDLWWGRGDPGHDAAQRGQAERRLRRALSRPGAHPDRVQGCARRDAAQGVSVSRRADGQW